MPQLSRRRLLGLLPAALALPTLADQQRARARIADIRTMVLQGPRTYTLVKVVSEDGHFGIAEGFGSPELGVKEGVLDLRPYFIGKDGLQIEALFNGLRGRTESSQTLLRAASAIEMALWDLAGKILEEPVSTLLGGRYREKIRVYCADGPPNLLDRTGCNEWADKMKADPAGWTAFQVPLPHKTARDSTSDATSHLATPHELADIKQGFEYLRDAVGWDIDLIVRCPDPYDLRSALQVCEALDPIKPLWIENLLADRSANNRIRLMGGCKARIAAGELLAQRSEFKDLIAEQVCDIVQFDLRNTGGFLESKKIGDLADLFHLPISVHNTGSAIHTMATVQWASSVRNFIVAETTIGRRNWMDDVFVHEGPVVAQGHITVPQKPGVGIELNPDVVRANLARGEKYWD